MACCEGAWISDQDCLPLACLLEAAWRRRIALTGTVGAIVQRPSSAVPTSAVKQASESKAGRHSQSLLIQQGVTEAVSPRPPL